MMIYVDFIMTYVDINLIIDNVINDYDLYFLLVYIFNNE